MVDLAGLVGPLQQCEQHIWRRAVPNRAGHHLRHEPVVVPQVRHLHQCMTPDSVSGEKQKREEEKRTTATHTGTDSNEGLQRIKMCHLSSPDDRICNTVLGCTSTSHEKGLCGPSDPISVK